MNSPMTLLAVFAVLWLAQIGGTAWQMRHYRRVLGEIAGRWQDGTAGVGNARSKLGKGLILILVVGPDDRIREALAMRGRTVFARFRPVARLQGLSLDEAGGQDSPAASDAGFRRAIALATAQIRRVREPETAEAALACPALAA